MDEKTQSRFLKKIRIDDAPHPVLGTACWRWTASKRKGYGQFNLGSRRIAEAHRVAYEFFVGPIPPGLHADRLCSSTRTNDWKRRMRAKEKTDAA